MTEQINKPVITGVSDPDRKAIEVLYRAFSEGADLLDEAVCSDWQDIPLAPGQAPGRDGMKPLIRAFQAAFPDGKIIVHEMIGGPGRVAVRAEITGTHLGEWFGIAP
ncbi:ester cyclase, partial [Thalassospira xiamenensis]|uniref:ester cyclase n=3 Tax=Thalassospiraceae TaxID=2844866 RepID=UPI00241FAD35